MRLTGPRLHQSWTFSELRIRQGARITLLTKKMNSTICFLSDSARKSLKFLAIGANNSNPVATGTGLRLSTRAKADPRRRSLEQPAHHRHCRQDVDRSQNWYDRRINLCSRRHRTQVRKELHASQLAHHRKTPDHFVATDTGLRLAPDVVETACSSSGALQTA